LINDMRKNFKLPGVPIRISFVKSDNPYAKNSSNKKR
jgi:predicted GTPase